MHNKCYLFLAHNTDIKCFSSSLQVYSANEARWSCEGGGQRTYGWGKFLDSPDSRFLKVMFSQCLTSTYLELTTCADCLTSRSFPNNLLTFDSDYSPPVADTYRESRDPSRLDSVCVATALNTGANLDRRNPCCTEHDWNWTATWPG